MQKLDDKIASYISDTVGCLKKSEAYVGNKIYNICLFAGGMENDKSCYYVAVTENDVLLSISSVREDLDERSSERMNRDLLRRVTDSLGDGWVIVPVVSEDETTSVTNQPVMIKLIGEENLSSNDKAIMMISSEINDWLDELIVMKSAKVSQKQYESYQQEYEKIMSANLIPHDKEEPKDYSTMMSIITVLCAAISVFFYDMCVFPVITIVAGIFSAYRCYTNKNYRALILCAISILVGLIFTYVGWQEFFITMNK